MATKLPFQELHVEDKGLYNQELGSVLNLEDTAFGNMLVLSEVFIEIEELVKQNFGLSEEKKSRYLAQNKAQLTLRDELEQANLKINDLQDSLKSLSS